MATSGQGAGNASAAADWAGTDNFRPGSAKHELGTEPELIPNHHYLWLLQSHGLFNCYTTNNDKWGGVLRLNPGHLLQDLSLVLPLAWQ